jgi:hypothetical protein
MVKHASADLQGDFWAAFRPSNRPQPFIRLTRKAFLTCENAYVFLHPQAIDPQTHRSPHFLAAIRPAQPGLQGAARVGLGDESAPGAVLVMLPPILEPIVAVDAVGRLTCSRIPGAFLVGCGEFAGCRTGGPHSAQVLLVLSM